MSRVEIEAKDLRDIHVGSVIEYGPNWMFKGVLARCEPVPDVWINEESKPIPTPYRIQIWTEDGRSVTLNAKEIIRL